MDKKITWKKFVYQCVIDLCNQRGKRTFSLQELWQSFQLAFENFSKDNHNVEAKVRQQLQFLRDDGLLSFLDQRGSYTLRGVEVLQDELEDDKILEVSRAAPTKREYLIETFARNKGWVAEAKNRFGVYCMCPNCKNTFVKPDGVPYIEVHHIIPMAEGGEDGLWNLAVLCGHHHRMAHFADSSTCLSLQKTLLAETQARLN